MAVSLPVVYVLVPATATIISVMLAITAWSRRETLGAVPFTVVLLSVAAWAFAYTMELLSTDVAGTLFWAKVSYLGVEVLPVAWILFALEFTGYERWSSRSLLALLAIEPVVVTVLVWTNEVHGLIWTDTTPVPFGDILVIAYSYGPAFWVNTVYAYGLVLVGLWLLVRQLLRISALHRRRVGAVIVGGALPWVGNLLFNAGVQPSPPLNITHLGFAISGGVFLWAFYHQQLLNPTQRFRERVFEAADTGMVLLNTDREIVDMNPAAGAVLDVSRDEAVGEPLDAVLPPGSTVFTRDGDRIYNDEITLPGEGASRRYAVEISSMYHPQQQRVMGQVVTFRGPL